MGSSFGKGVSHNLGPPGEAGGWRVWGGEGGVERGNTYHETKRGMKCSDISVELVVAPILSRPPPISDGKG